jgi:hypothetical protein
MVQQIQPPPESETAGLSVMTLIVIAAGVLMAVGAAFFVRPSAKVDDKMVLQAPVVSGATLTMAQPKPAPQSEAPAKAPALSRDRELLAERMANAEVRQEKTRSIVVKPQPVAPLTATPGLPAASAFAPAAAPPADQSSALQTLASLPPPKPNEDDAQRQQMAEDAAKAIREGDIAGARAILEKSMAAGDQTAVLALAETYDPVLLTAMKVKDVKADPQRARSLYEQAQKAGDKEARRRLAALKRYERRN